MFLVCYSQRISRVSYKVLLAVTSLMFILSAAFWVDGIIHIALEISNIVDGKPELNGGNVGQITLFNALVLINVSLCL
jgi:hypothetical protein